MIEKNLAICAILLLFNSFLGFLIWVACGDVKTGDNPPFLKFLFLSPAALISKRIRNLLRTNVNKETL